MCNQTKKKKEEEEKKKKTWYVPNPPRALGWSLPGSKWQTADSKPASLGEEDTTSTLNIFLTEKQLTASLTPFYLIFSKFVDMTLFWILLTNNCVFVCFCFT